MGKSDGKLFRYNQGVNKLVGLGYEESFKEVSQFIQPKINSENLHFLLGSGCSYPAINFMGNTFAELKPELIEIDQNILGKFNSDNDEDSKNIEAYLNWLKNGIEFLNDEKGSNYKQAFNMVRKKLIESITSQEKYRAPEGKVKATLNNYEAFYRSIFNKRQHKKLAPVNIFTSNYDLFNEISLENNGINYTNGFKGIVQRIFDPSVYRLRLVDDENRYKDKWSTIRDYVKLYKIHGSIDWQLDEQGDIIQTNKAPTNEQEKVLIYPTIGKHTETQGSPYSELFREFSMNLQKGDSTLFIIGYGFPDEHINQIISQSLNNEDFNLIVFGDLSEQNAQNFYNSHKHKVNFHFISGKETIDASGTPEEISNGHHFNKVISYLGGIDT